MPSPTSAVLDDFNRANEALTGNWTVLAGGLNIVSNAVVPQTAADAAIWNAATFGPDLESFYDITSKQANGSGIAVGIVRSGTFDGYGAALIPAAGNDTLRLERYDAGAPTTLASDSSVEIANGDTLAYQLEGTTHRLYLRQSGVWSLMLSTTDSTYTGQTDYRLLMSMLAVSMSVDNFGGGNISGGVRRFILVRP